MFFLILLLVTFFLTAGVAGLCLALNVKNCAVRLEARQLSNLQLRAHARGDLGPPDRIATAYGIRWAGGLAALVGLGMILAPLIAALIG
ncbi:hypothetical protein [Streptomyces sp. NBC_00094]|uniref:hypothetical protein n=1 Tax=Streptomyces sp. NBC_00094 TaxID=2903620 RepID=UPI00225B6CCA|nr:hypothetical protein [Streptomyces sp. NBC_00094]MCX5392649.1 hypothetical protein [Streptomyces sp. NBC_00094]